MGLAMWNTEETYRDVHHIVEAIDKEVYTALINPTETECKDNGCNGKLVSIIILLLR